MNTKSLRQKLLDLAIRGKLVPQDPNDEPAIKLLHRINPSFTPPQYDEPLPQGWMACTIGDIFHHNTGKALNKTVPIKGQLLPYLTTSNVYWNRFDLTEVRKMYFNDSELEKCTVKKGDLLVCEGGDFGRSAIWESEETICIQNHIHRLRAKKGIVNHRLYIYVFMLYKATQIISGKGIGLLGLSSKVLDKIVVPLPPLAEQKRIVREIERWFAYIDTIEQSKEALLEAMKRMRSKFLDLAIQGKLVPQDPNDEPAIELLHRINPKFTPPQYDEPLPQGWLWCKLSDIVEIKDNLRKPINSSERNARIAGKECKLYPYYGATGQVGYIDEYLMDGKYLLLGEDGAPFFDKFATKAYIVEGKCWVNNHAHVLRPLCNTEYMCYYLNQFSYYKYVSGSTRLKLTQANMRIIPVPIPPLAEQQRIVARIEELFATLDKIQESVD